jgi:hypothetical protein
MERPQSRKLKLVLALMSVVVLGAAPSCGSGDDVVRVLGHELGKLDDIAERVPRSRLPGPVTTTREAVQAEIDSMMAVLRGEANTPSAKQSANAACIASDFSEVTSMELAVNAALQQTNTPVGRRETVEKLARDLSQAKTSGDEAKIYAQVGICQWAGS